MLREAFGPYLLIRFLKKGGMGLVYIARSLDGVVVVKRLRPDTVTLPGFSERFRHEGTIALRLDHPNIVRAIDAGTIDDVPYIASELIEGQDAGGVVDRLNDLGIALPAPIAARILADVLTGLSYVHTAREPNGRWLRLVHRDVTPGNVLIGYDGRARLADFGLAKSALNSHLKLTGEGMIIGTPIYLAPEIARGEIATPLSDIYSTGAVLYRLLTGLPPYSGEPGEILRAIATGPPTLRLTDARPDLPRWLGAMVERMMAQDPQKRGDSAGALLHELHRSAKGHVTLSSEDLRGWMSDKFAAEKAALEADLAHYAALADETPRFGKVTLQLRAPSTPLEAGLEPTFSPARPADSPTEIETTAAIASDTQRVEIRSAAMTPPPSRGGMRLLQTALVAAVAALAGVYAGTQLLDRPAQIDSRRQVELAERLVELRRIAREKGIVVSQFDEARKALLDGDLARATLLLDQIESDVQE